MKTENTGQEVGRAKYIYANTQIVGTYYLHVVVHLKKKW